MLEALANGSFLIEYVGEVVDLAEAARRSERYRADGKPHNFIFTLNEHTTGKWRLIYGCFWWRFYST